MKCKYCDKELSKTSQFPVRKFKERRIENAKAIIESLSDSEIDDFIEAIKLKRSFRSFK